MVQLNLTACPASRWTSDLEDQETFERIRTGRTARLPVSRNNAATRASHKTRAGKRASKRVAQHMFGQNRRRHQTGVTF